jgi:indolepyruvate ferredoxin oxidoreductase
VIDELVMRLDEGNRALAVEIASLPDAIRGYGHVKRGSIDAARTRQAALLERLRQGEPARPAMSLAA